MASNSDPKSESDGQSTLVPAGSFADILKDLSLDDKPSEETNPWLRPPLPESIEAKPSITFQKIEIRENITPAGHSEIQLFGVTKAGHSICVHVINFKHYFYYPAPNGFSKDDLDPLRDYLNAGRFIVSSIDLEDQSTTPNGSPLLFLKIYIYDHRYMRKVKDKFTLWMFTSGNCQYKDLFSSPERTFEADIPYFLRFMIDNEVTAMTWLKIPAEKYRIFPSAMKISCCQIEVSVEMEDLLICEPVDNREKIAPLRILSFDIECNVPDTDGQFSNAKKDPVIQIGNMVSNYGQAVPFIRNVFTLGSCSPISGTQLLSFEDEKEMLTAWHRFFVEVDPDIVIGYNITQFDIPYLLERARTLNLPLFPFLGRIKSSPQRLSTKGRGHNYCPSYDGRLILDVYHHIREHHPGLQGEGAYKLNGVSLHFLGQRKEDIHYKQIPALQKGDANTRRDLAVYCLKDVYLPLLLFDKLKCFEKEMKATKQAFIPFNMMRTWRPLKEVAKRCLDAIEHQHVLADRS